MSKHADLEVADPDSLSSHHWRTLRSRTLLRRQRGGTVNDAVDAAARVTLTVVRTV